MSEQKNKLIRVLFRASDYDNPSRIEFEKEFVSSNEKAFLIYRKMREINLDETTHHILRDLLNYADTYLPIPEMYSLLDGSFTHAALARTVSAKYLDDAIRHMEDLNPEMTLRMLRARFYDFPSSTKLSELKYLFVCVKELQSRLYKKYALFDEPEFYKG